jgi:hypothetical protein
MMREPHRVRVPRTLLHARQLTVVALLLAAVGFVTQMVAGVTDTPTIPPGLVLILAAALLVASVPGRWAPIAGPVAGVFNVVAFVVVGAADRLVDPNPPAGFVGAWTMVPALVVAAVAGTATVVRSHSDTSAADVEVRTDDAAGHPESHT